MRKRKVGENDRIEVRWNISRRKKKRKSERKRKEGRKQERLKGFK